MWHSPIEIGWIGALAHVAGRWPMLDRLMVALADNELLKAVPYVLVIVAFWHCRGARRRDTARREIVAGIVAAGVAVLISRVLQNTVPSVRPVWDPRYAGFFPDEFRRVIDPDYHSFPSDHLALLTPLALTVWRLDRRLGLAGLAWLALLAGVRVYLGLHFPLDVAAGVLLGALALAVVDRASRPMGAAVDGVRVLGRRWPGLTAAALFFIGFQYATLFDAMRDLGGRLVHALAMLR